MIIWSTATAIRRSLRCLRGGDQYPSYMIRLLSRCDWAVDRLPVWVVGRQVPQHDHFPHERLLTAGGEVFPGHSKGFDF